MGDVLSPGGGILPWASLPPRIIDTGRIRAYQKLTSHLRAIPLIEPTPGPHLIFFAESNDEHSHRIWQYDVAPQNRTTNSAHISTTYNPVRTLQARAGITNVIPTAPPPTGTDLQRVILRIPNSRAGGNLTRPLAL